MQMQQLSEAAHSDWDAFKPEPDDQVQPRRSCLNQLARGFKHWTRCLLLLMGEQPHYCRPTKAAQDAGLEIRGNDGRENAAGKLKLKSSRKKG